MGAGPVVSLNNKIGVVNLSGYGNISITQDPTLPCIIISGNTGDYANFYPASNPSGFLTTGQVIKYSAFLSSGVETEFISYPFSLGAKPTAINCELENDRDRFIYVISLSGVGANGFFSNYSDILSNSGYKLQITVNR